MTFNRLAPTDQGTDREVRGDRNGPGRTWVGQTHTKALSVQWSNLSPNKSPCNPLWLNFLKYTWNVTPGHWWHDLKYNRDFWSLIPLKIAVCIVSHRHSSRPAHWLRGKHMHHDSVFAVIINQRWSSGPIMKQFGVEPQHNRNHWHKHGP